MNKIKIHTAVAIIAALSLAGCKGESPEHRAALALQQSADSAYNVGDYKLSIALIDSLNKTYPLEVDIRKATGMSRAKAYEALASTELPRLEQQISALSDSIEQMRAGFHKLQPSKALPGYYVWGEAAETQFNAGPTVQARVNEGMDAVDTPWTLAVNAGRNIGLNTLAVTLSDGTQFRMRVITADGQTGTITPESAAPLAEALVGNKTLTVKATEAIGDKGKAPIRLSPAQTHSIAVAFEYAAAMTRIRALIVDREEYDRMLTIARDQAANAAPDPASAQSDETK